VPRTGQREGIYVVKLHGDVADAEHLVLTRDAYDTFFQHRPAMALLLEGLLLNETFFFVGYSLRDPNFRQIYARISGMLQDALRPAFATILYPDRGTGKYLKRQWKRKGLNLILFEEKDGEAPEQQLLCFLDRLAERVTRQTSHFFLARDVELEELSEPLRTLRQDVLIADVGERVKEACATASRPEEVRHVAELLAFLTFQGWRPARTSPVHLSDLWEILAARCEDQPAQRRRMLMIALRNTERMDDAERILEQLRTLERNTSPRDGRPPAILPDDDDKPGMGLL
jgi:SIR2-like protein